MNQGQPASHFPPIDTGIRVLQPKVTIVVAPTPSRNYPKEVVLKLPENIPTTDYSHYRELCLPPSHTSILLNEDHQTTTLFKNLDNAQKTVPSPSGRHSLSEFLLNNNQSNSLAELYPAQIENLCKLYNEDFQTQFREKIRQIRLALLSKLLSPFAPDSSLLTKKQKSDERLNNDEIHAVHILKNLDEEELKIIKRTFLFWDDKTIYTRFVITQINHHLLPPTSTKLQALVHLLKLFKSQPNEQLKILDQISCSFLGNLSTEQSQEILKQLKAPHQDVFDALIERKNFDFISQLLEKNPPHKKDQEKIIHLLNQLNFKQIKKLDDELSPELSLKLHIKLLNDYKGKSFTQEKKVAQFTIDLIDLFPLENILLKDALNEISSEFWENLTQAEIKIILVALQDHPIQHDAFIQAFLKITPINDQRLIPLLANLDNTALAQLYISNTDAETKLKLLIYMFNERKYGEKKDDNRIEIIRYLSSINAVNKSALDQLPAKFWENLTKVDVQAIQEELKENKATQWDAFIEAIKEKIPDLLPWVLINNLKVLTGKTNELKDILRQFPPVFFSNLTPAMIKAQLKDDPNQCDALEFVTSEKKLVHALTEKPCDAAKVDRILSESIPEVINYTIHNKLDEKTKMQLFVIILNTGNNSWHENGPNLFIEHLLPLASMNEETLSQLSTEFLGNLTQTQVIAAQAQLKNRPALSKKLDELVLEKRHELWSRALSKMPCDYQEVMRLLYLRDPSFDQNQDIKNKMIALFTDLTQQQSRNLAGALINHSTLTFENKLHLLVTLEYQEHITVDFLKKIKPWLSENKKEDPLLREYYYRLSQAGLQQGMGPFRKILGIDQRKRSSLGQRIKREAIASLTTHLQQEKAFLKAPPELPPIKQTQTPPSFWHRAISTLKRWTGRIIGGVLGFLGGAAAGVVVTGGTLGWGAPLIPVMAMGGMLAGAAIGDTVQHAGIPLAQAIRQWFTGSKKDKAQASENVVSRVTHNPLFGERRPPSPELEISPSSSVPNLAGYISDTSSWRDSSDSEPDTAFKTATPFLTTRVDNAYAYPKSNRSDALAFQPDQLV